jgi:hypothetical protein
LVDEARLSSVGEIELIANFKAQRKTLDSMAFNALTKTSIRQEVAME